MSRISESKPHLPKIDQSKFYLTHAPRPLLARDADSVYWMSRYVERAEHGARILWVNFNLSMDIGELTPRAQQRQWQSVLTIFRVNDIPPGEGSFGQRVLRYMTFDTNNANSVASCLNSARENARGMRETISMEMWENLNTLYWAMRSDDVQTRFEDSPEDLWRQIMTGSMLFQGLTDQTLPHGQRWFFAQLAKYLERIDVTCRVIETKFQSMRQSEAQMEMPIRNIHWMSALRSCCSIEAYRRSNFGDLDPLRVASFLMLEPTFPRSIRFCVERAHEAISAIRADTNPRAIDPAERVLGRLSAQLQYAEMSEILDQGLPTYLQQIQSSIAEAAVAVQKTYFLH